MNLNSSCLGRRAALLGRTLLLVVLLLGATACVVSLSPPAPPYSAAQRQYDPNYTDWNNLLARHVTPQGVDYAGFKKDQGLLEVALTKLTEVTPEQFRNWSRDARLAFLINAHNAHTIARVLRHYPVRSLGQTGSLINWPRKEHNIRLLGRNDWSLDELVEEIMSYPYRESRAIFLLNWGAQGCAPLPPVAATAVNLSDLLETQTRAVMADPRYHSYNLEKNIIYVSRLLKWYRPELERDYADLWSFLKRYLPEKESKTLQGQPPRIRYQKFDKTLNDTALTAPQPEPAAPQAPAPQAPAPKAPAAAAATPVASTVAASSPETPALPTPPAPPAQ